MDVPVPPWAHDLFGDHDEKVRAGIGHALRNMQANAQTAHTETAAETKHAYGWSRYSGQFARIWDELKDLPGARKVKPKAFQFSLTLVGRGLIYPFRYAETTADVSLARVPSASALIRELFSFAPAYEEDLSLFDSLQDEAEPAEVALRAGLADLPKDTSLVLVPFACNADGLLESYWGIGSLGEDRRLQWKFRPQRVQLPTEPTVRRIPAQRSENLAAVAEVPAQQGPELEQVGATARFDHGEEPEFGLAMRPAIDRQRRDRDDEKPGTPPQTEHEPEKPQASEDDEKPQ
ncbi:hypothetical protein AB0F71_25380 [Kitasatospora sp. NPDC028055]|uniref:hypothetical protein n=1 Tax=Kitasatospora TaxID=2063 RepID=UPI0033F1855B